MRTYFDLGFDNAYKELLARRNKENFSQWLQNEKEFIQEKMAKYENNSQSDYSFFYGMYCALTEMV